MGGSTRAYFLEVLAGTVDVLEQAGADHLLIGSLAATSYLGDGWDPSEDIDVLVRERDAEPLLDRFAAAGYAVKRHDEGWIYKAARPNVTVDLIFRAGEHIHLDNEHLARAVPADFDGVGVVLPDRADLVVMKAIFDAVDRPGSWHTCVRLVEQGGIDWPYLVRRARAHGSRRLLALLLYAESAGIDVPRDAITALGDADESLLKKD